RLHDRVRGSRRAAPLRRAVSPAAGGFRAQLVLDVGTGRRLGHEGARGRRARAAAPVLRELPPAGRLQPPGPGAERLERYLDRRLHRPGGGLERAVAAPEALRLEAGELGSLPRQKALASSGSCRLLFSAGEPTFHAARARRSAANAARADAA